MTSCDIDCGGCYCHTSAPCHHCVEHMDPEPDADREAKDSTIDAD